MAEDWVALPIETPLFANLDGDAVVSGLTALENGYINEQGTHTRFPGLREFADLGGNARVFLSDFNGDLIAATDKGKIYRVDSGANISDVTGVPVSGGRRVIFAKSDREVMMAAGGTIVRLRDRKTELLSSSAPLATHIAWIDNYTIAVETNSGRFFHSTAGRPDVWDPLDTFAADGNPDNINSIIVTPFRELLLGGAKSIEQFERQSTDPPFFRRWAVGDGVKLPYGVLFADNALWTINNLTEFVRFTGQTSQAHSGEVGRLLERVDDWSEAWIGGYPDQPLHTLGQKFILIQAPNATNTYGTKGVTLLYDYRQKRYSMLFGWDDANGIPRRWPGWSHWTLWGRIFVGGNGKIYELTDATYANGTELQRWLIRTAHMAQGPGVQVTGFRLRVVRGKGTSSTAANIQVRCSRDGRAFGPWITRSLGKAGERLPFIEFGAFGNGSSFQFEISSADNTPLDLLKAEIKAIPLGH